MAVIRIVGRVALVTLFIFTLVAVALAQDNGAQTPAVAVDDQVSTNGTVTVRLVTAPQAAFLVIQRDLVGIPGPVIGQVAVPVGTTENIVIPLTEAVAPGNLLYAALYVDAGQPGVFEVPGADAPFVLNDQTIAQPFTITDSGEQQAQQDQAAQVTPSPTVAVSPTVTVSPTVLLSLPLSPTVQPTGQAQQTPITATVEVTPQGQQVPVVPPLQPTQQDQQAQATPTTAPQDQPATPTVQPTPQDQQAQVTPTATVDVQATADAAATPEQQGAASPPTPMRMPVTGAGGPANLPATLLFGALAFVLFVGGNTLLQRRHK